MGPDGRVHVIASVTEDVANKVLLDTAHVITELVDVTDRVGEVVFVPIVVNAELLVHPFTGSVMDKLYDPAVLTVIEELLILPTIPDPVQVYVLDEGLAIEVIITVLEEHVIDELGAIVTLGIIVFIPTATCAALVEHPLDVFVIVHV